jgi:hypothetical protein
LRRMRWAGHVAHMGRGEYYTGFLWGKLWETDQWTPEFHKICSFIHSFIHSFIMHSVNPYKVKQPMGYRTCHNINVS